jgi:hypothetical protein
MVVIYGSPRKLTQKELCLGQGSTRVDLLEFHLGARLPTTDDLSVTSWSSMN